MYKFHQIPTNEYVPISHEKAYLFISYEKVLNFLAYNLDKNSSEILAKPIQTSTAVDWYSSRSSLKQIELLDADQKEEALAQYWNFIDRINLLITSKLKNSKDPNKLDWASILEKIFDSQNNIIFSNGTDIAIIWGWQFFNNNNYKPSTNSVLSSGIADPNQNNQSGNGNSTSTNSSTFTEERTTEKTTFEEETLNEEEPIEPETVEHLNFDEEPYQKPELVEKQSSFMRFLKWFASNFWWLLLILLLIILLLLLMRNCEHERNYNGVNHDIENLQQNLNERCN